MPYIYFEKNLQNKFSVKNYALYLEKENDDKIKKGEEDLEHFFDQKSDNIKVDHVTKMIDGNKGKLKKDEEKFYSLYISPSEKELLHIGNDKIQLKEYSRKVMSLYAKNFGKGLSENDLLYFGKVESIRKYKGNDPEVKNGFVKQGAEKKGLNSHVHIIISRNTKSKWYKGERIVSSNGEILIDDHEKIKKSFGLRISPKDKAKGGEQFSLNGSKVRRGFNVNRFKEVSEEKFDTMFQYLRDDKEKFDYLRLKKNHPMEFVKKYGSKGLEVSVDLKGHDNRAADKLHAVKEINRASDLYEKGSSDFNERLGQKGVKFKGNQVHDKNSSFEPQELNSYVSNEVLGVMNSIFKQSKVSKKLFGQEKDEENEKEI